MEFDAQAWTEIIFAEIGCMHTDDLDHCEEKCPCCLSMKASIRQHVECIYNAGRSEAE